MNRVAGLTEIPVCPATVAAFYDRYRGRIAGAAAERLPGILGDMQEDFERAVRQNPQIRDELAAVYEVLKIKCREVHG